MRSGRAACGDAVPAVRVGVGVHEVPGDAGVVHSRYAAGDSGVGDQAGDAVDRRERVGAEAFDLGGVEQAPDLPADRRHRLLGVRFLGGDVEQAALEAEADEPEEPFVDAAPAVEDAVEEPDHRLDGPAQDAAGHDDGRRGAGEQGGGAQAVGDDGERGDVDELLGEVEAGARGVEGDDVARLHQRCGASGDGPLGLGGDALPELEGALVGALGDRGRRRGCGAAWSDVRGLEVLADGDGGDAEAAAQLADLDAAVLVEVEEDRLFAVELAERRHRPPRPVAVARA